MGVRVGHLDIDRQAARPGSQPEVHLVDELTHTLPLVDAKAWSAIGELEGSCVDGRACQCRMSCGSQVPLDSAREPGISQPEIAELYPVVVVEKLSTADLVLQRPEPATKVEKNNGEQMVILEGRHPGLLWHELAGVVILQQVRQHAVHVSVTDVARHLRVQPGAIDVVVQIPEKAQRRKRIYAPPPWRGQDDRADIEDRHFSPSTVNHLNLQGLTYTDLHGGAPG